VRPVTRITPPVFVRKDILRCQKRRREEKNRNPPMFARLLHVHRKAPPVPTPL